MNPRDRRKVSWRRFSYYAKTCVCANDRYTGTALTVLLILSNAKIPCKVPSHSLQSRVGFFFSFFSLAAFSFFFFITKGERERERRKERARPTEREGKRPFVQQQLDGEGRSTLQSAVDRCTYTRTHGPLQCGSSNENAAHTVQSVGPEASRREHTHNTIERYIGESPSLQRQKRGHKNSEARVTCGA